MGRASEQRVYHCAAWGHNARSGCGSEAVILAISPGSSSFHKRSKTAFATPSASRGNCGGSSCATGAKVHRLLGRQPVAQRMEDGAQGAIGMMARAQMVLFLELLKPKICRLNCMV